MVYFRESVNRIPCAFFWWTLAVTFAIFISKMANDGVRSGEFWYWMLLSLPGFALLISAATWVRVRAELSYADPSCSETEHA